MKIALVDDEQECLDEMAQLCSDFGVQHHCQMETISFTSGEAFLNAFENGGFSVVFMDIYMSGMDGVAAAQKMRNLDSRCILVFLTSTTEFMPDAFSCHAFEYITKPFSPQRVQKILTDILEVLPSSSQYIEVVCSRKTIQVSIDKIISVTTDAHYLDIGLSDGEKLRCRMTMREFMGRIEVDTRFILVNKGITVNADYILAFEDNCCILENGVQYPIRVRDRLKIEQAARDYNFEKIRSRQRYGRRGKG